MITNSMATKKIAIDGPAGAGKSTMAQAVAEKLGFIYIDTGAMYRAVALYFLENNLKYENIEDKLQNIIIDIKHINNEQLIFLNGENVSGRIRTPQVGSAASDISAIPTVRVTLVEMQRKLAKKYNVVMDGRDIGTYVLPDADVKIYLTATLEERAKRRFDQLCLQGIKVTLEEIVKDIEYRDKNDSNREFAPLTKAHDAILIDTTGNSLQKSIGIIVSTVESRLQ